MQHTSVDVPHFDASEWTFLRGALSTVDRPYHFVDFFHHNIGTSHVVHHLFSRLPHYHAAEATEALKRVLGSYYQYDPTPVFQAFWREYPKCRFVAPVAGAGGNGLLWFRPSFKK